MNLLKMTENCSGVTEGSEVGAEGVEHQGETMLDRLQAKCDYPLHASIGITERCHLSCPHCYLGEASRQNELSLNDIEVLFDELMNLGVFNLTITGGEPALRRDLLEIVSAAWRRRFLITLKTSGSMTSPEEIEELRKNGLSKLDVSLYHFQAEKHDAFVGFDGAWEKTMACIKHFSSLGGAVGVHTVLMRWNTEALPGLKSLCDREGWRYSLDLKLVHKNDKGDAPLEQRASESQLEGALNQYVENIEPGALRMADEPLCKGGENTVHIISNGDVWICPLLPVSMGNIKLKSFKEIWDESELRKELRRATWGGSPECAHCESAGFCSRCPGESFLEHGDFQKVNSLDCMVASSKRRAWTSSGKV